MNNAFTSLWSDRIGGPLFGQSQKTYKFEKIKQAKIRALTQYPEKTLLDFGIGEPDAPPNQTIIEALYQEALKPHNHSYADNGCIDFLESVASYMQNLFSVSLNPNNEILHSIGSKAALSMLPACFINPGDITLTTVPGYPIAATHAQYYGGIIHALPLHANNNYLPNFDTLDSQVLHKTKILILNYPNNPTGASATESFYEKAVYYAKKYQFIIIQDAAYAALTHTPLSILSIPGAKDVAIELHSLSKSFNMTGWRIGWVCGNHQLINAYGHIKNNTDSGQFLAIQKAAIQALNNYKTLLPPLIDKYQRRLQALATCLNTLGLQVSSPNAGFFLYIPAPTQCIHKETGQTTLFSDAESFSQWLIENHSICTVPWDDVHPSIRFSTTFHAPDILSEKNTLETLQKRLQPYTFTYST